MAGITTNPFCAGITNPAPTTFPTTNIAGPAMVGIPGGLAAGGASAYEALRPPAVAISRPSWAIPAGAILSSGNVSDGVETFELLDAVGNSAQQGMESAAGMDPAVWVFVGSLALLGLVHLLLCRGRVGINSSNARRILSYGISGLRISGSAEAIKWLDEGKIRGLLEGRDKFSSSQDFDTLVKSAAAVLTFDPTAKTPLGISALTSFLGLYWEGVGDKRNAVQMRRAEAKILDNSRPELWYQMRRAAVHHDEVLKRISDKAPASDAIGDPDLIRSLHTFSAAQLFFQSADAGTAGSEIAGDLSHAKVASTLALLHIKESQRSGRMPEGIAPAVEAIALGMQKLYDEVVRAGTRNPSDGAGN